MHRFRIFWVFLLAIVLSPPVSGQTETEKILEKAIRDIQSSDDKQRMKGAYALNDLGKEALPALPQIIEGIKDSEDQIWFQCIDLIAKLGPDAEKALPTLMDSMRNNRRRYRNQVAYRTAFAIGRIGEASVPYIRKLMDEDSDALRLIGALSVTWLGDHGTQVIPDMLDILDDENEEVRRVLAESFGHIGEDAIAPLISVLTTEKNQKRLTTALQSIGYVGPNAQKTQAHVAKFLKPDQEGPVQLQAIKTLGHLRLEGEQLAEYLNPMMGIESNEVWDHLLEAFLRSQNKSTLAPWIQKQFSTDNPIVKQRLVHLIQRIGPPVQSLTPELIAHIKNIGEDQRSASIQALKSLGQNVFMPLIIELASQNYDPSFDSKWELEVLRSVGSQSQSDLISALGSETDTVLWSSMDTLGHLKLNSPQSSLKIKQLTNHPESHIRSKALTTLVQLGLPSRELLAIVQNHINDPESHVRLTAVKSIPSLGDAATALETPILEGISSQSESDRLLYLEAVKSLPSIPNKILDLLLRDLTKGSDPEVTLRLQALARMKEKASSTLPQLKSASLPQTIIVQSAWLNALAQIGPSDEDVEKILRNYLEHKQVGLRKLAFETLPGLSYGIQERLKILESGLGDEAQSVREIAANQVRNLGSAARSLDKKLFSMLQVKNDDYAFVIETLKSIRSQEVSLYVKALENPETAVRMFAAEALGRMGRRAESAIPSLRKVAVNDEYQPIRRTASNSIRNITRRR